MLEKSVLVDDGSLIVDCSGTMDVVPVPSNSEEVEPVSVVRLFWIVVRSCSSVLSEGVEDGVEDETIVVEASNNVDVCGIVTVDPIEVNA